MVYDCAAQPHVPVHCPICCRSHEYVAHSAAKHGCDGCGAAPQRLVCTCCCGWPLHAEVATHWMLRVWMPCCWPPEEHVREHDENGVTSSWYDWHGGRVGHEVVTELHATGHAAPFTAIRAGSW